MSKLVAKLVDAGHFLWDVIVPRFVTEDVALNRIKRGPAGDLDCYEIACSMADVAGWEQFDAVATVHAFQAFGFGFAYRVGNIRPWVGRAVRHD